jgi:hypothetical protein
MRNRSLLEQQTQLLKFLTGSAGIFGRDDGAYTDPTQAKFDRGRLRLEAKFSFEKRFSKISGVLPLTFRCLGDIPEDWLMDFVDTYPPSSATRYDNARQFCDYLSDRWAAHPPEPPHIPDLAAYEIAYATVLAFDRAGHIASRSSTRTEANSEGGRLMRRHPAARIVRCDFDIRDIILRLKTNSVLPARHPVAMVITLAPEGGAPAVFHMPTDVVELLTSLDDWTDVNIRMRQEEPGLLEHLGEFVENHLLEISG